MKRRKPPLAEEFQTAISDNIDTFLDSGLTPEQVREVLRGEADSDLEMRLAELRAMTAENGS